MASNRLHIVPGTSASFVIDIVDQDGEPLSSDALAGADVKARFRQDINAGDVLAFATPDAAHLSLNTIASTITLALLVADTNALTVGVQYFWQLELDLADGQVKIVVDWSPVDVNLGGSAATPPPPFASTVKLDHDYPLAGDMRYMTPGGSPVENAQIRVYLKSDYDAGKLDAPIGVSLTNARGEWVTPVLVPPGYSWTIRFEKPYEWGPDAKQIIGV